MAQKKKQGGQPGNKGNPAPVGQKASTLQRRLESQQRQHQRERFFQMKQWADEMHGLSTQEKQLPMNGQVRVIQEASCAIASILLADVAGGLLPGVTMAQRIDAAKELRKGQAAGGGEALDSVKHLLQQHGTAGARDLIEAMRDKKTKTIESEQPGEAQHKRVAE